MASTNLTTDFKVADISLAAVVARRSAWPRRRCPV